MKVLLLCAGYGTRFVRDVEQNPDYAHLQGVPKPLLPIAGKPLISHWTHAIDKYNASSECFDKITDVCTVVNDLFKEKYEEWTKEIPLPINLVNDGSRSNDSRLGAVACIQLALEKSLGVDNHVLIIAGDTLLPSDFSLLSLVKRFKEINDHAIKKGTPPATLIIDCPCPDSEVHKHGIIETDSAMRVTSFLEKPSVDQTASRKQCPAFYLIHSQHLGKIKEFLDSKRDQPLASRDATGNLLRYLIEQKSPVYSMSVSKRFDVGGLATYIQCSREFEELKNDK